MKIVTTLGVGMHMKGDNTCLFYNYIQNHKTFAHTHKTKKNPKKQPNPPKENKPTKLIHFPEKLYSIITYL